MMNTPWWQRRGPMSIGDPLTATRVGVGIQKDPLALLPLGLEQIFQSLDVYFPFWITFLFPLGVNVIKSNKFQRSQPTTTTNGQWLMF